MRAGGRHLGGRPSVGRAGGTAGWNGAREDRHGVLGVCLGHELIAAELGLDIVRKEVP
ncbi:hypothetical protein ABT136_32820, partial [Streptomyces sp. NPDC001856]|uniref:glutamine amidotransferase-related protein n=1 Tax=Streptomyces sp. NPDC001856 TaxID=3154399 RepID=UPI003321538E